MVLLQLLGFPNVLTVGPLIGQGPDTLIWLWTLWHIGPPLFALPYALLERGGRSPAIRSGQTAVVGWLVVLASLVVIGSAGVLVTRYVHLLPKNVQGDDYSLLTASGVGPAVELLTLGSLLLLCWTTRLRTVLQLWLAVSLCLLVLDNVITDVGGARGTIGWAAGRIGALLAGITMLGVYLMELDFLRRRAQTIAVSEQAERQRAQSARDRLDTALKAAGMGGWECDLAARSWTRTDRFDQIMGTEAGVASWGQADLLRLVAAEDRERVISAFAGAAATGHIEVECRIKRANDQELRWISVQGRTIRTSQGNDVGKGHDLGLAGCIMDTTERRQTEERLRNSVRLEAIGKLTGGVAHDFNNLLTVITGSLELIQSGPADPNHVKTLVANALAAAQRGAQMTSSLLSFSRQQVMRREIVNVNRMIQSFTPLLRQAIGTHVELVLDLDLAIDPARIDAHQLEAALLNLAVNARDAMPGGGRLTITTENATMPGTKNGRHEVDAGAYVRIAVTDTGFGMDAATARIAFEPFFTTKDIGKGTGLGLSQVYGFAKQAGGDAVIVSQAGHGTTVELLLPCVVASAAEPTPAPAAVPPSPGLPRPAAHDEVVLVVEDEPDVLDLVVRALHSLNYKTLTADCAATALLRLRSSDRIDVMLSDVIMPGGMNGVQLALAARAIREDIKIVLTSGYTAAALKDDHELPLDTLLLSKPYGRAKLASMLQNILHVGEKLGNTDPH